MKDFFSLDNPFNRFMTLVFDIALLSILFAVCSLPVVTFGASAAALYSVMLRRVRNEEGAILKGFFQAFRENFRQGTIAGLIFIAINLLMFLDYRLISVIQNVTLAAVSAAAIMMVVLMTAGVFAYVFPLIARYENSLRAAFNNAWRLAVINLPKTIVLVVLNNLPLLFLILRTDIFVPFIMLWCFILAGTAAYINSKILRGIFDRLFPDETAGDESGKGDE
ncbi:MAG: DUF624 domain-containing protein [Lachnospiraceae bacterium]|jgi:uncharacterized membrane protein YesL|nr:DUF624 domain-containing protein [Lachnospiraceae bacterium]MEE3456406.1 DUF624 domain-containing protein [Lachnospiraceae bacterium]